MIIVHIGLPKTGTTFLQYRVFAPAFGRDFYHWKNSEQVRRIRRAIQHRQTGYSEEMLSAARYFGRKRERRPIIITCENISSQGEGFWAGTGPSPLEVGEQLRSFRDAAGLKPYEFKVLVGVRRQDQMLASRYSQYSLHFEDSSQEDFETRAAAILEATSIQSGHRWLYYDHVWHDLGQIFGPNSVCMYSQEGLSADLPAVLKGFGRDFF